MPAITLYGRRWHFSTDIVAIPSTLSALFHGAWILILLVWAAATDGWPGACATSDGRHYVVLFGGLLFSFAANLVLDCLLTWQSLRGGPFEASKRRWVVPLLYACTVPLVAQLVLTAYGTHVVSFYVPDCWPDDREHAVRTLARGLVFSTWGFMGIASLGVLVTYNMYPQHHDLSSWAARCECIASCLCCHKNVVRRPDGKRPPLTNIAELTAGLLSHCDLDATDITAALFLASAAQNRRRRLRVAKALLPVYKALRDGTSSAAGGSGGSDGGLVLDGSGRWRRQAAEGADEEEGEETEEGETDDASSTSSLNEVPNDRDLDRMIAEQDERRRAAAAADGRPLAGMEPDGASLAAAPGTPRQDGQGGLLQRAADGISRRVGGKGKSVRWAADQGEQQAEAAQLTSAAALMAAGQPLLGPIAEEADGTGLEEASNGVAANGSSGGGKEVPLTEQAVAMLDQQQAAMEAGQAGAVLPQQGAASQVQQAAEMVAGEALGTLLQEVPPGEDVAGQLADAIEEEIRRLGGGRLPEDAVLAVAKEDSLDLSSLQINPEAPSIWFSAGASAQGGPEGSRGLGSAFGSGTGLSEAAAADEAAAEAALPEGLPAQQEPSASPFAAVSGAAGGQKLAGAAEGGSEDSSSSSEEGPVEGVRRAALIEAAAAAAISTDGSEPSLGSSQQGDQAGSPEAVPPADEAAAAAVAEAAAAAQAGSLNASPRSGAASTAAGSSVGGSSRLDLSKQLTVKYPVVITPSEHVDEFRGPLPAAVLADIYAGRHDKVPSSVLREATHFLKYSYAVYSLAPKLEAPSSGLDVLACLHEKADPAKLVFKGLAELEGLEDDASVELLHLNCSNRVLAHLPYLIALDHGRKAVVLAIRGTISAADLVTDAIVYPEPLDSWLPADLQEELGEPAFAHAGMMAAARAIFEDMTERGILQELVEEEDVGEYTAPQGQQAQRDPQQAQLAGGLGGVPVGSGGRGRTGVEGRPSPPESQYDADAGRSGRGAAAYNVGRSSGRRAGSGDRDSSRGRERASAGCFSGRRAAASVPPAARRSPPVRSQSLVSRQSDHRAGPSGRLWAGSSESAAHEERKEKEGSPGAVTGIPGPGSAAPAGRFQHFSFGGKQRRSRGPDSGEEWRGSALGGAGEEGEGEEGEEMSPGRRVGEIMRRKIEEEGWQLVVEGHSLGAGAAALVSLKLRSQFPGLKCIAYSCPGSLVSKKLAHAMAPFTTTVVVGKDAVCRASVPNMARLMDEMVTALARCKQPKLKVLFWPWWKRRKAHFRQLFWDYGEIPPEPLAVLQAYYESRSGIGLPVSMYPPGRLIFLRPIKTRQAKDWDAVWIQPEDLMAEGLLVSQHALRDHLCSTAYEALTASAARMDGLESGAPGALSGQADAHSRVTVQRRQRAKARRREAAQRRQRVRQHLAAQRAASLEAVLIQAS